jgi:hypothetical protein
MIGEASVILMDDDLAQPILDVYRGNGNTLQPKQVTVEIIDSRIKPTDTTKADTLLSGRGFKIRSVAQQSNAGVEPRTILRYSSDQRNGALLLSRYLIGVPVYQEVTGLNKLTLTLGSDYAGVLLLAKTEADMAGQFPGLSSASGATAAPTTAPVPTTTLRGASGAASGAATTAVAVAPTVGQAPTTTSGIYGKPPEGVTCK